ncbi:preprotein translocase subunit SecY [Candidatus Kuenenbacteria bacterium CG11_big_fil_rev_8_21_14_0_20_37_9]|uniref:Protein translocase subunit SecY n=2 Tax=Candidatus Kueneniibacteriota TaxID=1752740 RepID=A0A2M6XRX3_9BACT|nr:MAG: preprotein translocase subunit SecY [Candidatus Kuenenbacteria bacterium CG1_02_38_13]PIR05790.1 MAG: preprotein translocase subunit SecY [Candidatus Kuenenbacteria bacterium CG11_big_fil_rev_8_21_14_0_20_37_9]PIU10329.1 MAG: preprotein translocase subunit SecY [Candidatus Kuenenbacteria bacterium CG08_land_8_20_14_0_20_37_23]
MKFTEKLIRIFKDNDLRKKIFFVLCLLFVFRVAAHIPVPGVDVVALRNFFADNQILGLLNIFSGGGMSNFSIVALGIGPYITASIIFQLLAMIVPKLEEISKEGESGQKKINQYTRLLTLPMAFLQGYSMIKLLQQSQRGIIGNISAFEYLTIIVILAAGTIFLMWLGELISEKKIGNGVSLIIFAGIVSGIPGSVQRTLATFDPSQILNLAVFLAIGVITVAGVVYITEAQRNIPVSYAKRVRGIRMYGGFDTHLPLRVNQAGMIPIIFAISLIMFPPLVAQMAMRAQSHVIVSASTFVMELFQNQIFYGALYFFLVVAFTYFYTAIIFHPQQIADNLQKQGGFVPGIRPGRQTAEYLGKTSNRIMLAGALSLGIVAILPLIIGPMTGVKSMVISGASLLIVVSVVIETVKQIESQLVMRDYDGF